MPVLFDSSSGAHASIGAAATSGSLSCSQNVNPNATNLVAVLAVLWGGGVDASGATFSATFGGSSMSLLDTVSWNSSKHLLKVFTLLSPPTGAAKSAVASFSGMGTEAVTRPLMVAAATYSGVLAVGSAAHTAGSGGGTTHNDIVGSSAVEANRVVSAHGVGLLNGFTGYSQTLRQPQQMLGGGLMLGDSRGGGGGSPDMLATMLISTVDWGNIAFELTAAPVTMNAALALEMNMSSKANIYRVQTPDPRRYWLIDA